ncbi:putative nucleotide-binding alpha-beta plait domain superfamily [Septoria linicola]|nr:putative nucleotide-binding alpha-beta plait domain superfamily [Septoria linicola]
MHNKNQWPTRGLHGDGGANSARFPAPRTGEYENFAPGTASALRAGVNNNFVPNFGANSGTQSTTNSGLHGLSASMTKSHRSSPNTDQELADMFDNKFAMRRDISTPFPPRVNASSDCKVESSHFQPPHQRPDHSSHRDSFSSDGTFATQLPSSAAFSAPYGPKLTDQRFISGQSNNMRPQDRQYVQGNGPQYRNGIDANVNGMNAGMSNLRVTDSGSPSRMARPNSVMPNGGYQTAYNGGRGAATHVGNNGYMGSHREGRSKFFADMVTRGETEDPYDRTMSRYDTPARLPNPTLGPARFKDSKVFATIGDAAANNGGSPSEMQMSSRAIVPMGKKPRPDWLGLAVQGLMVPSLEEAFDALPLTELCRATSNNLAGVIRIKDIPYGTTRQEMIAFVGRNAQVLRQPAGSPYHAVHILMERESGKTMDCFIEVTSPTEAAWVARQFARRVEQKRTPKVGDRSVEVLYSSQDDLMVELFPRAKHVRWSNGQPVVDRSERKYYPDKPAAGFQGFLHPEELVAMGKHASLSERSPFANKSPCRVYEAMITLLHKYPWHCVEEITIGERRAIFDCAIGLIKTLIIDIRRANNKFSPLHPTPALLQELGSAALVCPGFTEKQKASIVNVLIQGGFKSMADGRDLSIKLGGQHPYSAWWPFSALGMPADADQEVLQYFAALFRQGTATPKDTSLAARKVAESSGYQENPMGNWDINYGPNASTLSLAQIGKIEFDEIERVLTVICEQQETQPPQHYGGAPGSMGPGSTSGSGTTSSAASRQNSANLNQAFY